MARGVRANCDVCGAPNAPTYYGDNLKLMRDRLDKYMTPDWIVLTGYAHQRCYKELVKQVEFVEGKPKVPRLGRCNLCGEWAAGYDPHRIKLQKQRAAQIDAVIHWQGEDTGYIHKECAKGVDEVIGDRQRYIEKLKRQG